MTTAPFLDVLEELTTTLCVPGSARLGDDGGGIDTALRAALPLSRLAPRGVARFR
jgi:hypothetical protein